MLGFVYLKRLLLFCNIRLIIYKRELFLEIKSVNTTNYSLKNYMEELNKFY